MITNYDRFFNNFFKVGDEITPTLSVRIDEEDSQYVLKAEVPGLSEDQVSVEFKDNTMIVIADYGDDKEDDPFSFRTGKFKRSFDAKEINSENVSAELKDGILTLTLPKREEVQPRKIAITSL